MARCFIYSKEDRHVESLQRSRCRTGDFYLDVEHLKELEEGILLSFYEGTADIEDESIAFVHDLEKGEYLRILNSPFCENVFIDILRESAEDEPLDERLEKSALRFVDQNATNPVELLHLLCVGVAALCACQQERCTGPPLPEGAPVPWFSEWNAQARIALERPAGGDVEGVDFKCPELLLLGQAVLSACARVEALQTGSWWWMRALFLHQCALGEPVPALHAQLEPLLEAGPPPLSSTPCHALLLLETASIHLWFGRLGRARDALTAAQNALGLSCELKGALGRRTRFQERALAQLTLQVDVREECQMQEPAEPCEDLPKDVALQDEVRLAQVVFCEEQPSLAALSPPQQAAVLCLFLLAQKSQPSDELAAEELKPYLQCVLTQPQWWVLEATALVLRSRLEASERRAAERSMMQLQEVCSAWERPGDASERGRGVWAVNAVSHVRAQMLLADQLARLGCLQSALDLFLALRRWEDAVACYTALGLRHQAAQLLKREIEAKPSVVLLCLLGDATDDAAHYERAWELSGQRSARAQRHWALFHFNKKEFAESVPHLRLSLELNSLQPELWRRLGYAALDARDWETCAQAYRRCCELDPECLEAWNNAAKAYIHLGDKERAWRALQEALKIDFENWRLWDNVYAVSADVGAFDEVVRAAHHLLDLREPAPQRSLENKKSLGALDPAVLQVLVRAVTDDLRDRDGRRARTHLRPKALELFGRLTTVEPAQAELWRLYASLTETQPDEETEAEAALRRELVAQRLLRAHRVATLHSAWAQRADEACSTLVTAEHLVRAHLLSAADQPKVKGMPLLASACLAAKGALAAVKKGDLATELAVEVGALEAQLAEVEAALATLRLEGQHFS